MNRMSFLFSLPVIGLSTKANNFESWKSSKMISIGIIGLDSTHAIAFTKEINNSLKYSEFRVTTAYPYGSKTIPLSKERIPKFTNEMKEMGICIASSIKELLKQVDCVLLETNDGNLHVAQALEVIHACKPLFIDKPIANSYEDALMLFQEARKFDCPIFSSSALRYIEGLGLLDKKQILGADIYSPAPTEQSHKDLYWYGIHGVEMLFTLMGPDCVWVQTIEGKDMSIYIGTWQDGRCATLRGIRNGKDAFGGTVFLNDEIVTLGLFKGYQPLLENILAFFKTGISPVPMEETLAICSFIDGAEKSKQSGGVKIKIK